MFRLFFGCLPVGGRFSSKTGGISQREGGTIFLQKKSASCGKGGLLFSARKKEQKSAGETPGPPARQAIGASGTQAVWKHAGVGATGFCAPSGCRNTALMGGWYRGIKDWAWGKPKGGMPYFRKKVLAAKAGKAFLRGEGCFRWGAHLLFTGRLNRRFRHFIKE